MGERPLAEIDRNIDTGIKQEVESLEEKYTKVNKSAGESSEIELAVDLVASDCGL